MATVDPVYNERYYSTSFGVSYERSQHWRRFFSNVARGIVGEYNPATVLDAGCAWGFLVEGLRGMGIQAFGVDISEYGIAQAHLSIAKFVRVGDITELPDRRFDVIACIEVLEHLTPEDGERAIERMTANTDVVLFSSTPHDFDDPTHINVQPFTHWWDLFGRHGFAPNITKTAAFVNQNARWFQRWQ